MGQPDAFGGEGGFGFGDGGVGGGFTLGGGGHGFTLGGGGGVFGVGHVEQARELGRRDDKLRTRRMGSRVVWLLLMFVTKQARILSVV